MKFNVTYASDYHREYCAFFDTMQELMDFIKDVKHDVIVSRDSICHEGEGYDGEIIIYDDYIE